MRRLAWLPPVLGCALAPACGGGELHLRDPKLVVGSADVRVEVATDRDEIALVRGSERLLLLDTRAFELGVVADLEPLAASWDPYWVETTADPRVRFVAPEAWTVVDAPPSEVALVLDYGGGLSARLAISLASAGAGDARISFGLSPAATGPGAPAVALARLRLRPDAKDEGLYGLGGRVDGVSARGRLVAVQRVSAPEAPLAREDVQAAVPLVVGTSGWGLFVDTLRSGVFDLGRKDASVVEATFAVAALRDDRRAELLRFDLVGGASGAALAREYWAATGGVRAPPPWAFGPWLARGGDAAQASLEADLDAIASGGLPCTGLLVEGDIASARGQFDFSPARFPDAPALFARARSAAVHVAVAGTPYVDDTGPPAGVARGFGAAAPAAFAANPPTDFVDPAAGAFFRPRIRAWTAAGVEGFSLAGGDEIATAGARRTGWSFADGSDERTMQRRYAGLLLRVYADAASGREPGTAPPLDEALPALFAENPHAGAASLGAILRPLPSDEGDLGARFTRALSAASAGHPFVALGPEAGDDDELFVRGVEAAALFPILLTRAAPASSPARLEAYRVHAALHLALFPYLWSNAVRLGEPGAALVAPVGLAHPELGVHPADELMLGGDLLAAPVLVRGQTKRRVVLPGGGWRDWWSDAAIAGGDPDGVEVDAPLERLPLFVREGALVPLLPPEAKVLGALEPGALGALHVRVVPGPPRATVLWDGTHLARTPEGALELRPGTIWTRGFVVELVATAEPSVVLVDDQPLARDDAAGWSWRPEGGGRLRVPVDARGARVEVR